MYPILEVVKVDNLNYVYEGQRFLAFDAENIFKDNILIAQMKDAKYLRYTSFSRKHGVYEEAELYLRISNSYVLSTLKLGDKLFLQSNAEVRVIGFFPGTFDDWFDYNDLKRKCLL